MRWLEQTPRALVRLGERHAQQFLARHKQVLAISGEKASASTLTPQMKLVATDVTVVEHKDTGHWLMEERPQETMDALLRFLQ